MRSAGSKLHLNHFSVIIHTPKPGTVSAMQMREVTWLSFGFVVTNPTIIMCWSKPNIYLVVPLTVYGIAVKYSSVFTLFSGQELLHSPPRQTDLLHGYGIVLCLATNRNGVLTELQKWRNGVSQRLMTRE